MIYKYNIKHILNNSIPHCVVKHISKSIIYDLVFTAKETLKSTYLESVINSCLQTVSTRNLETTQNRIGSSNLKENY